MNKSITYDEAISRIEAGETALAIITSPNGTRLSFPDGQEEVILVRLRKTGNDWEPTELVYSTRLRENFHHWTEVKAQTLARWAREAKWLTCNPSIDERYEQDPKRYIHFPNNHEYGIYVRVPERFRGRTVICEFRTVDP